MVDETTGELRRRRRPSRTTRPLRLLHRTIAGVRDDFAALRFNTAIAKLIELNNHLTKAGAARSPRAVAEPLVLMLAPLAPHIAEELWARLGHAASLAYGPFPVADRRCWSPRRRVPDPGQRQGALAGHGRRPTPTRDAVEAAALADAKIVELLDGGAPRKVIVVPGRLVNVVV